MDAVKNERKPLYSPEEIDNFVALGNVLRSIRDDMAAAGVDIDEYRKQLGLEKRSKHDKLIKHISPYEIYTKQTTE